MTDITKDQVLDALRAVRAPDGRQDVVARGMISGIVVRGRNVGFALEAGDADPTALEPLRRRCEETVKALPDVASVSAVLTAERAPGGRDQRPPPDLTSRHAPQPLAPGVTSIIAVASGKGGVGKSTTAVNLAMGLAVAGVRVGMLDADIYGPSLPRMLGVTQRPVARPDKKLMPMEAFGVKVMSMGFMVDEDAPMIWRGPMVQSALQQMLGDVLWGELDVLVVDMPPGTGDAQLTMAQRVPLAGAVIVSTPQDIALLDARKAINMFRKVDVPVLGIVENMSYFLCPQCGHRSEIFAYGGARQCASTYGIDFLAEIPLDAKIRELSDDGRPIVISAPSSPQAQAYRDLALTVRDKLVSAHHREPPRIVYA